jgi:hypothetical protein
VEQLLTCRATADLWSNCRLVEQLLTCKATAEENDFENLCSTRLRKLTSIFAPGHTCVLVNDIANHLAVVGEGTSVDSSGILNVVKHIDSWKQMQVISTL